MLFPVTHAERGLVFNYFYLSLFHGACVFSWILSTSKILLSPIYTEREDNCKFAAAVIIISPFWQYSLNHCATSLTKAGQKHITLLFQVTNLAEVLHVSICNWCQTVTDQWFIFQILSSFFFLFQERLCRLHLHSFKIYYCCKVLHGCRDFCFCVECAEL